MTDQTTEETIEERYTEAPFSANVFMIHPSGAKVQFTIRDSKVGRGMKHFDQMIQNRLDSGYALDSRSATPSNSSEPAVETQICKGFMIIHDIKNGKKTTSVKLPFNLNNGEEAKFPKMVFGSAVELFLKAIAAAGIEPQAGEFYDIPIKVSWSQGKPIPSTDPNAPVKHYTDWKNFEVLPREPANPPAKKQPINQPPVEDQIPF